MRWSDGGRVLKRSGAVPRRKMARLKRRARNRASRDRGEDHQGFQVMTSAEPLPRLRTLMFWVYDDLEKLAPRLDRRVDKMVEVGVCA